MLSESIPFHRNCMNFTLLKKFMSKPNLEFTPVFRPIHLMYGTNTTYRRKLISSHEYVLREGLPPGFNILSPEAITILAPN